MVRKNSFDLKVELRIKSVTRWHDATHLRSEQVMCRLVFLKWTEVYKRTPPTGQDAVDFYLLASSFRYNRFAFVLNFYYFELIKFFKRYSKYYFRLAVGIGAESHFTCNQTESARIGAKFYRCIWVPAELSLILLDSYQFRDEFCYLKVGPELVQFYKRKSWLLFQMKNHIFKYTWVFTCIFLYMKHRIGIRDMIVDYF